MWIKFKDIGCLVAERAFYTVVPSSITRNKDKTAGRQNATRRFFIFGNTQVLDVFSADNAPTQTWLGSRPSYLFSSLSLIL
jgi:hypothetical protein